MAKLSNETRYQAQRAIDSFSNATGHLAELASGFDLLGKPLDDNKIIDHVTYVALSITCLTNKFDFLLDSLGIEPTAVRNSDGTYDYDKIGAKLVRNIQLAKEEAELAEAVKNG